MKNLRSIPMMKNVWQFMLKGENEAFCKKCFQSRAFAFEVGKEIGEAKI